MSNITKDEFASPKAHITFFRYFAGALTVPVLVVQHTYEKHVSKELAGKTLLHTAAMKGYVCATEIICRTGLWGVNALDAGDPKRYDKGGHTPFERAMQTRQYEVLRVLGRHGANLPEGATRGAYSTPTMRPILAALDLKHAAAQAAL